MPRQHAVAAAWPSGTEFPPDAPENEIASIVAVQLAWIREAAGDLTGFPKQAMLGI